MHKKRRSNLCTDQNGVRRGPIQPSKLAFRTALCVDSECDDGRPPKGARTSKKPVHRRARGPQKPESTIENLILHGCPRRVGIRRRRASERAARPKQRTRYGTHATRSAAVSAHNARSTRVSTHSKRACWDELHKKRRLLKVEPFNSQRWGYKH